MFRRELICSYRGEDGEECGKALEIFIKAVRVTVRTEEGSERSILNHVVVRTPEYEKQLELPPSENGNSPIVFIKMGIVMAFPTHFTFLEISKPAHWHGPITAP